MKTAAVSMLLSASVMASPLTMEATRQYQDAVALVTAARYRDAIPSLNALAKSYPTVPEIFATRCSAQLGIGSNAGAEADCRYAISLQPSLSTALYGLAVAEDNQGKAPAAAQHYREFAARGDAPPSLAGQARLRADQLAGAPAAQPMPVAAPPPPGTQVAAAGPVPVQTSNGRGTLLIYRNHYFRDGDQQVTLLVDDQIIGDIGHDQYIEVQLPLGDHTVEACIGGVRYRSNGGFPMLEINTAGGHFDARLGSTGGSRERLRGMTVPVEVTSGGPAYVNFDHSGGRIMLTNQPPSQGAREIESDCKKAFTKRL